MVGLIWLRGLLLRRPMRLVGVVAGIAVAVALLASIGAFLSASRSTMTRRAVTEVAVDWQVEVQPPADPAGVLTQVSATPGVTQAVEVGYGSTTGLQATTGASTQSTGPGVVLGIPSDYATRFPGVIRPLVGSPTGVLVAQQTAANLQVAPGDTISVGRIGLADVTIRVDGVIELPQADSLFQQVGAPVGAAAQAPPDNVLLLPQEQWRNLFEPLTATPGQVHTQVHATLDHSLPADPSAAYSRVTGRARNLEVTLAGTGVVGNNLAATLGSARSDALYAQVLFLFLGLPGAILAGLLAVAIASSGADRRITEQSLLRARGATSRQLVRLATAEGLLVGALGSGAGLAVALCIGRISFGTISFGGSTGTTLGFAIAASLLGLAIALTSITLPAWRSARNATVATNRLVVGRHRSPWWMRYGVDLVLLAGSALVYWLTSRNGYTLILVPEGVPTISVDYWAFAGPALLWIGAGLFAWRLSDLVLGRTRSVAFAARPLAHRLAPTVAATMGRQRHLLSRSLVLVALTVSFAVSTAVFNSTYRQQGAIDAALTNGADVTVTESPGAAVGPTAGDTIAAVSGVRHVEPLQHRFAYVGADLQDLYGVRTDTVVAAGRLQDAYFAGGSARDLMAKLAAQPDSILVSQETVKDFQLLPGDQLTLRLQDGRSKQYTDVRFHYVGVAKEFPTAQRDSFLVANADYVTQQTGTDAVGAFLVDTGGGHQQQTADAVRHAVGTQAIVTDLQTSRHVVGSSLTAVDLAGLTKVELSFALLLAAASTGLVLALGLADRRRTFAIASALGASRRQLRGFIVTEAVFVTLGGVAAGAVGAWLLSQMLVNVLTGVFDPAPAHLSVPWAYFVALTAAAIAATAVAVVALSRATRRNPTVVLREA